MVGIIMAFGVMLVLAEIIVLCMASSMAEEMEQENKKLQQRIDKAIEIIDRYDFSEDNIICDIRKILKGDSNE